MSEHSKSADDRVRIEWRVSKGEGSIHSLTSVERAPTAAFHADVPYTIALVDLDEGLRIIARVQGADFQDAAIGSSVHVVYEQVSPDISLSQVKLTPG